MKKNVWIVLISVMAAQCVFWILTGILMLTSSSQSAAIALMMIANGVAFGVLALVCRKRYLIIKIATFIFLFVNLVLTVTDQVGAMDIVVLVLNLVALLCCLFLFIGNDNTQNKNC